MRKIFIAGHRGLVGGAILRLLTARQNSGERLDLVTRTHAELDLTDQHAVRDFMQSMRLDEVILAAARVGGIVANSSHPADFIYENLMIQTNVIHQAYKAGVQKLLFLGSNCIYPRITAQPIREDMLLTGTLEPTNEPYALAKIAGIKLCESYNRQYGTDFRAVMPANLYGPHDNFHPQNSHVFPGLIRRFHEAAVTGQAEVVVWGTGTPRREFLHVDDMASASMFVHEFPDAVFRANTAPMLSHINIGTGTDISIADLAGMIAEATGFKGTIRFDVSKPDGTPQKLMDITRLTKMGWRAQTPLDIGIKQTLRWFVENQNAFRS